MFTNPERSVETSSGFFDEITLGKISPKTITSTVIKITLTEIAYSDSTSSIGLTLNAIIVPTRAMPTLMKLFAIKIVRRSFCGCSRSFATSFFALDLLFEKFSTVDVGKEKKATSEAEASPDKNNKAKIKTTGTNRS
jgi:hypothetical protein